MHLYPTQSHHPILSQDSKFSILLHNGISAGMSHAEMLSPLDMLVEAFVNVFVKASNTENLCQMLG